jgi:hypothetical protein
MRDIKMLPFERLPQPLQFKNKRRTLRTDTVSARFAGPAAPRKPVAMIPAVGGPHD